MAAVPDPGALYNQTLADLGRQEALSLAAIGEGEGDLRTNINQAEQGISEREPGTYRAETNAAQRQGLLTSGINSGRKSEIASRFGAARAANQARLSQGLGSFQKQREQAGLTRETGERAAAQRRLEQQEAYNAANPPLPPSSWAGGADTINPRTGAVFAGGPGNVKSQTPGSKFTPPKVRAIKPQNTTRG